MKIRLIGAAIVAAVLPAVAGAAQINPTLRVEGQSTNVVPLMPFAVQNSATALVTSDASLRPWSKVLACPRLC